jgi:hypothetical protein
VGASAAGGAGKPSASLRLRMAHKVRVRCTGVRLRSGLTEGGCWQQPVEDADEDDVFADMDDDFEELGAWCPRLPDVRNSDVRLWATDVDERLQRERRAALVADMMKLLAVLRPPWEEGAAADAAARLVRLSPLSNPARVGAWTEGAMGTTDRRRRLWRPSTRRCVRTCRHSMGLCT